MSDQEFTVYFIGTHAVRDPKDARNELAAVNARMEMLPFLTAEDELIESTRGADGLIVVSAPITRPVLEALENCRVVLRTGVGVDNIDIEAATDLGIAVVNVPDLWSREVANHALALLLACNRQVLTKDSAIRSGDWATAFPTPVGSLHGETLGIVGLGRIGRALAKRAAALEFDLLACDPYIPDSVFQEYGAARVSFEELLDRSDYVSVHCPHTDETRHMFDEEAFRRMKSTAYLVNTARGPVMNEIALLKALQEDWIAGAALDVMETEPPDRENPLLRLDNVILTSHVAYYSDPAVASLPLRCGQEVARVLTGRMPRNLVNPEVLEKLSLRSD